MSLANFIIALLGLVCVIAGGFWKVYCAIANKIDMIDVKNQEKIDNIVNKTLIRTEQLEKETQLITSRLYERMDDNKKQYYTDFVLKEVHNETIRHWNELTDQKFMSMLRVFESTMNSTTKEIRDLKEYMIERLNHKS